MSFTEQELLNDLITKTETIGIPEVVALESVKNLTTKSITVFVTNDDEPPTGVNKNVLYYVLNAGEDNESAYYHESMSWLLPEPKPPIITESDLVTEV